MSIPIKAVAFILHPAADIPASRKFYEQVLGLKIGLEIEFQPGMWWIEYDIAGTALGISNAFPGKPCSCLTLEVSDLDASLSGLRAAGVPIAREIQEFPPCRMFAATDPFGNEIGFHQRKA
jgi:predicted enzyme related to lactoylglutathione lyase